MRSSISIKFDALTFLIGLNVLLFVIPFTLELLLGTQVQGTHGLFLYLLGGLHKYWAIVEGETWRVITSAFLHVDVIHLLANMIGLYQLGKIVRAFYGGRMLFVFYILTGLAGSVISLIFLPDVATVGASGAVFGLMGVLVAGSIKRTRYGLQLPFKLTDILPIVLFSFFIGLTPGIGVNNWAHLGGFFGGLILGRLFHHQIVTWKSPLERSAEFGIFYLSVIIFLGSYALMLINLTGTILS